MEKGKLTISQTSAAGWYEKEVKKQRKSYLRQCRVSKDPGYVWPFLTLEIFLEGVFTMKPMPGSISVDIPKGKFNLTLMQKGEEAKWLVRNDASGAIATYEVKSIIEWAIENYPDGIDSEGYNRLAFILLTTGCPKSESDKIWCDSFYEEVA